MHTCRYVRAVRRPRASFSKPCRKPGQTWRSCAPCRRRANRPGEAKPQRYAVAVDVFRANHQAGRSKRASALPPPRLAFAPARQINTAHLAFDNRCGSEALILAMTRRARDDPIPARALFESSAKYPSTQITTRRASVLIAPEPAFRVEQQERRCADRRPRSCRSGVVRSRRSVRAGVARSADSVAP
jgi:hypothetical protein